MTTSYIRGTTAADAKAILFPVDSTLGFTVNQAKLDPTNDEVAAGASAGQTGGGTAYSLIGANSDNAQVIKSTPGRLLSFYSLNGGGTLLWLKFYDKATAPTAADTPVLRYALATSAAYPLNIQFPPGGLAFSAGIAIRCVTGQADNDNTSPASGAFNISANYK